jgi:hypothetical protein
MPEIFHLRQIRKNAQKLLSNEMLDRIIPQELVDHDGLTPMERADRTLQAINNMKMYLSDDEIRIIRKSTSCNLTKFQIEIIDKAKKFSNRIDDQLCRINEGLFPSFIDKKNYAFEFSFNYSKCICRTFNKVKNANAPKEFCLCCAGNVEKIFSHWLDKDVNSELLEVLLDGGSNCRFSVKYLV